MKNRVYGLKTIDPDYTSRGGFRWREWEGKPYVIKAPDWSDEPKCGGGIHFALNGKGDGRLFSWDADALWVVVEANEKSVVDLGGKAKARAVRVLYVGDQKTATDMILNLCGDVACIGCYKVGGDKSVVAGGDGSTVTGGDRSIVMGGDRSIVTGGDCSTLTGGDCSALTGGDCSAVTGGDESILTGGYGSTVAGGDGSTVTGGDRSTVTGGDGSTVTGGGRSVVTGEDRSVVTGGDGSTVTGGYMSTVTGGHDSVLTGGDISVLTGGDRSILVGGYVSILTGGYGSILSWKCHNKVGKIIVGENGIKPNTPYIGGFVDGKFVVEEKK